MENYHVHVTATAREHLESIRHYLMYELQSPVAAKKLLILLKKSISKLAVMPTSYRVIDEEPWGSQGVRKVHVKNYYIYYWVDEHNLEVFVLSVIYAKRNQRQQLIKFL